MRVIEVITTDQKTRYYLEDDEGTPVKPVLQYLRFRDHAGYARNTLRMQCIYLKHYFTFPEEAGHKNIYTTLNTYVHPSDEEVSAEFRKVSEKLKLPNMGKAGER